MGRQPNPSKEPDSASVRVRRSQAHKKGDHSLCRPEYCPALGGAGNRRYSSPIASVEPTEGEGAAVELEFDPEELQSIREMHGLGDAGERFWQEMSKDLIKDGAHPGPMPAGKKQLLIQACRIVDIMDFLSGQIAGKTLDRYIKKLDGDSHIEVVMYCDKVLTEFREQATALRGLVNEITKAEKSDSTTVNVNVERPKEPERVNALAARLNQRRLA